LASRANGRSASTTPDASEPDRAWLQEAPQTVGARVASHGGSLRYAAYIGPRTGRLLTATSHRYPKADQAGGVA
jgi:hypothetical protein